MVDRCWGYAAEEGQVKVEGKALIFLLSADLQTGLPVQLSTSDRD